MRSVGLNQIEHDRGLTVASMAASLDLPEETVRRKCTELADDGWLARGDKGYVVGEKVDPGIFAMVEENIDRMIQTTGKITE